MNAQKLFYIVALVLCSVTRLDSQKLPLKTLGKTAAASATTEQVTQQLLQQTVPSLSGKPLSQVVFPSVADIQRQITQGNLTPFPTVTANKIFLQRYYESKPAYMIPVEKNHSISPQRSAFDGGKYPNFLTLQMMTAFREVKREGASEYITPEQRLRYTSDVNILRNLYKKILQHQPQTPEALDNVTQYLRHSVPPETMRFIKKTYWDFVVESEEIHNEISTWLIYATLPNEGKRLSPQKNRRFNELIQKMNFKTTSLMLHFADDPFLEAQKEYWGYLFGTINPAFRGQLAVDLNHRPDNRVFKSKQFFLYYLNGRSYLFPSQQYSFAGKTFTYSGSSTLILDPEDKEDQDIFQTRAEMNHITQLAKQLEPERIKRVEQMPKNLRIAFINDDANPRANFAYWNKQGFLGQGATLDVFTNGADFMDQVRKGKRYDLILTDLLVDYGGLFMMLELRQLDSTAAVIAVSKYEPEEILEELLFNAGMDGYLWYNANLDRGMIGYMEYLRAMNNYYHMRDKYGWAR